VPASASQRRPSPPGLNLCLCLYIILCLCSAEEPQAVSEVVGGRTPALRSGVLHAHEQVQQARGARGEVADQPAAASSQLQRGHEVHSAGRPRLEPQHVVVAWEMEYEYGVREMERERVRERQAGSHQVLLPGYASATRCSSLTSLSFPGEEEGRPSWRRCSSSEAGNVSRRQRFEPCDYTTQSHR
jgi:hypothetical protein